MIQNRKKTGKIVSTTSLRPILDKLFALVIYIKPVRISNGQISILIPACPLRGACYLLSILALISAILTSVPAKAEIYTYEDGSGTVHFTNVPTDPQYKMITPPKKAKNEENAEIIKGKGMQTDFGNLIKMKSYKYGLDPALVKAVIAIESDFNPHAISEKGARGLMQLMPMTANELGVTNSFDPEANIDGGTRYLKYLLDYFNWDVDRALAAYHAGMMRVVRHTGIPPIPATHQYVKKVKKVYQKYILQ